MWPAGTLTSNDLYNFFGNYVMGYLRQDKVLFSKLEIIVSYGNAFLTNNKLSLRQL